MIAQSRGGKRSHKLLFYVEKPTCFSQPVRILQLGPGPGVTALQRARW